MTIKFAHLSSVQAFRSFVFLVVLSVSPIGVACAAPEPGKTHIIYVGPSGTNHGSGAGSAADPFVLSAGHEYELNRILQPALDQGQPVKVVFEDGVYHDVRLQILKQGIDTGSIYVTQDVPGQHKITSHLNDRAHCNTEGQNCRVVAQDFTIGADTDTPLELTAEHPGRAIFDGSGTRQTDPAIDSEALVISGSLFGGPPGDPYHVKSHKIQHIIVDGLTFRNYRDGIHVRYAEDVTVRNCWVESIGNRIPRTRAEQLFGTFGLRADGDSSLVMFINNKVTDIWNVGGTANFAAGEADPGLIHSIYYGYAHDIFFVSNALTGSSGPMLKFGFYPITRDGQTYNYPAAPSDRRSFFIGNSFTLTPMKQGATVIPTYAPVQAFIHENSRELAKGGETPPAAGIVFLGNVFDNRLPPDTAVAVALLRQELPHEGDIPSFPGWIFSGNTIKGIGPDNLLVDRVRDTPVMATSIQRTAADAKIARAINLASQIGAVRSNMLQTKWHQEIEELLHGALGSQDKKSDERIIFFSKRYN